MMRRPRRGIGRRLLALVLYLYPATFRSRYGEELLSLHERRLARRPGGMGRAAENLAGLCSALINIAPTWRDAWRGPAVAATPHGEHWMSHLLYEAGRSARILFTRQWSFTALCVITLALGLGAVTAIFSIVHGVLLAPLPYGEPERIVRVFQQPPGQGFGVFSGPNFTDLRDRSQRFEALASYDGYVPEGMDLTGGDRVERLRVLRVSSGYFETLGVKPVVGRTFTRNEELPLNSAALAAAEASEDGPDVEPVMPYVVVVSHDFWRRHLSGSVDAVGKWLSLDQQQFEVIGVMPANLGGHLGGSPDLWLPLNLAPGGRNSRGNLYMSVIGRLADGTSLENARMELDRATEQLRQEHPRLNEDLALSAAALDEVVLGSSRSMLWILFAAVAAMLAIACINVANLFLARGLGLGRELRIRAALGAGGRRLFAATLIEGLWIGLAGGVLGLGAAWLAVRWIHVLQPAALPRFDALAIDRPVFAFSLAAVLVTVLIFGLWPALRAAKVDVRPSSEARGGVAAGGRRDRRLRDWGVSLQVALSLVLLSAGALLGRSFLTLQGTDMGFEAERALTFQLRLPDYAYELPEQRVGFYDELFRNLDAAPEIEASGATSRLPGNGHRNHWVFFIEGREQEEGMPWPTAEIRCVGGQALDALAIPVRSGRGLTATDTANGSAVVVVNQALADAFFDGRPLGQQVYVSDQEPRTIVGVVGDARHDPRQEAVPKIYVPHSQFAGDRNWDLSFIVTRPEGSRLPWDSLRQRVEAVVADLDTRLVVYDVEPLAVVAAEAIAKQRFAAQLMMVFAALSLLLSAVGLFGALAYSLAQRRAEIGVRMALGADRRSVLATVLGHCLRVVVIGAMLGLAGVFVAGRWLGSQLHGIEPHDPTALLVAVAVLFLAAAVATVGPIRRALRLDPARILTQS